MVFTGHENDTDVEEALKPTLVAPPGLKIVNRGDTPTSPSPNRKKKKKKGVTKDSEGNELTLIIREPYKREPPKSAGGKECAAMCLSCGLTGYGCSEADCHISLCFAKTDQLNCVCGVNALTGCCFCCLWPAWAECVHKAFGVEWGKEQTTFTTRR
ncbi:hypothetical protein TrST_g1862 [Triparma strigata]|uniref:Uncharacterized protein n=1 Tax=Triparma strigata TaxID=1606541 RepID=A0A9W7BG25_9STRA|nr:hypothetical protein TrST_g1862 [Triparma strigata]